MRFALYKVIRLKSSEGDDNDYFKDTVLSAAESAETGDIVLLSPACAAFDRFKNFSVRGRYFKQIVMEL